MPEVSNKVYGEFVVKRLATKMKVPNHVALPQYSATDIENLGIMGKSLGDADALYDAFDEVLETHVGPTMPKASAILKAIENQMGWWWALKKVPGRVQTDVEDIAESATSAVSDTALAVGKKALPWVVGGVALWIFLPRIVSAGVTGAKKAIMK
jgi:hypothetical protein